MDEKKILKEAMQLYEETLKSKEHGQVVLEECREVTEGEEELSYKIESGWEIDMDKLSAKECVAALYIACLGYTIGREIILKGSFDTTCNKLRSENEGLPSVYYWLGDSAKYDPVADIEQMHYVLYNR